LRTYFEIGYLTLLGVTLTVYAYTGEAHSNPMGADGCGQAMQKAQENDPWGFENGISNTEGLFLAKVGGAYPLEHFILSADETKLQRRSLVSTDDCRVEENAQMDRQFCSLDSILPYCNVNDFVRKNLFSSKNHAIRAGPSV
jgi:hypothetical protein